MCAGWPSVSRFGKRADELLLTLLRVAVLLFPAAMVETIELSGTTAGWILVAFIVPAVLFHDGMPTIAAQTLHR